MKSICFISTFAFILTGCATTQTLPPPATVHTASITQPAPPILKNPIAVTFYKNGQRPPTPYKIIGKEVVSKYNVAGFKRQEANILDSMRAIAASMGGDAIINMVRDEQSISGTIIAYDQGPLNHQNNG